MSKYIIDIPDGFEWGVVTCRTEDGFYTRDFDFLEELNSDYINEHYGELQDEAYQRGHDDGYEAGCATAFKPVSDAEYQRGLEDAWVAVRKIVSMPDDSYWELFGDYKAEIIKNTTVSEVIAKLKAYEDKHSDRIEVGDEVEWDGDKCIVTYININIDTSEAKDYDLMMYDGSVIDHVKECRFTKTGKHYDIASILEAMRE